MNDDLAVEFQPGEKDVPIDNSPENKNMPRSEQVFDISEDNISPIKEESEKISPNQVFSIKKVIQTPPPGAKPPIKPIEKVEPTPNLNWKIEQKDIPKSTLDTNPTKNILDPNYINPDSLQAKTVPPASISKSLPPLPETPAFKGTLDQKPHSFTPTPLVKPDTVSIKDMPAPSYKPFTPNVTINKVQTPQQPPQKINPIPVTPVKPANLAPNLNPVSTPPNITKEVPVKPVPEIPKTEKSFGSIPLKDLSKPLASVRNVPANPPAKTLGSIPETSEQNGKVSAPGNSDLKNLRTYESDVAEVLARKKTSVASIAIAENKEKEVPKENNQPVKKQGNGSSKFILMLVSILLIAFGIFGAYYFYSKSPLASLSNVVEQKNEPSLTASIVPTDSQVNIEIKNLNPVGIAEKITAEFNKAQNPSTIKELVITKDKVRVTAPEMLEIMDIEVPDILKRSLTTSWLLGIYSDGVGNKDLLVITKTNFFQNTFAGMLQWENLMADELKLYLSSAKGIANVPVEIQTGTSTESLASTTPNNESPIDPYFTIRGQFKDRIVTNKDVRIFQTSEGNTLFLYSFINNSTLLFATKEETVSEVLKRLENQAFVR